jgi:hypothetical protein
MKIAESQASSAKRQATALRLEACSLSLVALCLCLGCHDAEPEEHAAAPATPQAISPVSHESLPRAIAGVSLGMSLTEAEARLGHLDCHNNQAGYRVCKGEKAAADVQNLELYVAHERVISVSYETAASSNAWDELNHLIDRFGRPSLSGVRERDTTGRLHEIYGWKDDDSLYSVRFMWRDTDADQPQLVGIVTALWDRKGYQQWEAETHQPGAPPTAGHEPPAEI